MTPLQAPALMQGLAVAAHAVAAVLHGHTPDALLADTPRHLRPMAMDLSLTTLRDYGRGDALLARLLSRPLKDRAVQALLLVALSRLERRPPAEAHTTVDQAVKTAAGLSGGHLKGLVNAVLRNFLRRRDALLVEIDDDPVARWRHPAWWLAALQAAYPAEWTSIAAAGNLHPPLCLRVNRRRWIDGHRLTSADFAADLAVSGIAARVLDDTALLLDTPVPVERLPGFGEGVCSIQDWGAQHAARLLDVTEGQRVLDACAAPGGKTAHLLEQADLALTALELDPLRARRVEDTLDRLRLKAAVRVGDARQPAAWWDDRPFDRILADVPCSAAGVVRRHPDIKWLRRQEDVAGFAQTQADILAALWPLLAVGGKMLYCTCSVFPEENSGQVNNFIARHPDARRLPIGDGPDLQLLPTTTHDGFYYALLEKLP